MFNSIVVVCTGNICRSPMAEALLRRQLPGHGRAIVSAGTHALTGAPADPLAVELMREHGVDIGAHRAQQLTGALLAQSDLLLVMEQNHVRWIVDAYPQYRGKTFRLGNWGTLGDVPDPYRKPKSEFAKAYLRLEADVAEWLKYLN